MHKRDTSNDGAGRSSGLPIKTKIFCNCNACDHKNCPDIFKLIPNPLNNISKESKQALPRKTIVSSSKLVKPPVTGKRKVCSTLCQRKPCPTKPTVKSNSKPCPKICKKDNKKVKPAINSPHSPSMVKMISERDCACELMARAVGTAVHMNLGMRGIRDDINEGLYDISDENVTLDEETNP